MALSKILSESLATGVGTGKFESALLHVRDEKSNNTAGGGFTSGSFQTRTLNTVMTNEISGASVATNQITLPSGTYFINASCPAVFVNQHKAKLRNITDSSDTLIGTSEFSANAIPDYVTTCSFVTGRFTIASAKNFELQHRCTTTRGGDGFGNASNFAVVEVYTDVQIWKVA
tara:strand:- start:13 stop:531 length:519 start_codon:yes stop_codon:yes gene_type:complete